MKNTEFTKLFKFLRVNSNLTIRALSKNLGLSATYLHDLENGNRDPNEKIVDALINFYELSFDNKRILYDSVTSSTDNLPYDVIRYLKENSQQFTKIINDM